jgi:uncharacterized protein (TIGR03067 family)
MRTLISLAALLCAVGAVPAGGNANAPVPKPQEGPTLEGTYTVNYTGTVQAGGWGVGPGGAGGGWGAGPGAVGGKGGKLGGPAGAIQTVMYTSVATISKSEITIGSSDTFGLRGANAAQTMTYAIDPTKTPMTIDVFTIDARNKKATAQGVVEVIDGRITLALAKPGAERPKTTDEAEDVTVYYFKKAPPPPKTEFRIVAMSIGKEADTEKELNKLAQEGYELVNTTNPVAADSKSAPTTVHFILKRTAKQP